MVRGRYIYLTGTILLIGVAAVWILPLGTIVCPWQSCRQATSTNLDFSSAPQHKLVMFPSAEGLSAIPPP